jgi:hypothetical protein
VLADDHLLDVGEDPGGCVVNDNVARLSGLRGHYGKTG